jgi:PIN domain nuclease of toxin-antitoxin system
MKILVDTHVFLWYITAHANLPTSWKSLLQDSGNDVYLSVVSVWEASIKFRIGKLALPEAPETFLPDQRLKHGFATLGLEEDAVRHLPNVPLLHRDPFDRMLICQALEHGLTLLTVDAAVRAYPVACLPVS